jgi:hypothetical protein
MAAAIRSNADDSPFADIGVLVPSTKALAAGVGGADVTVGLAGSEAQAVASKTTACALSHKRIS